MKNVNIDKSIFSIARKFLELEKRTIEHLIQTLNVPFNLIVHFLYRSSGIVGIPDVDRNTIIGQNNVSNLNSTGTAAVLLYAGDALHGDPGISKKLMPFLAFLKSGCAHENKIILNRNQKLGHKIIDITSNLNLLMPSDYLQPTQFDSMTNPNNRIPTCSTNAPRMRTIPASDQKDKVLKGKYYPPFQNKKFTTTTSGIFHTNLLALKPVEIKIKTYAIC